MSKNLRSLVGVMSVVAMFAGGCRQIRPPPRVTFPQDSALQLLTEELRRAQPPPFDLPENSTYNYVWAQYAMAFLALQRCGYMDRTETVARISAILERAATFERFHGFWYDRYDPNTGMRASDNVYFQSWWLYALYVLKHAYPELRSSCEALLADVDYVSSGLYDPETRQLAADLDTKTMRISYWIDLYATPSGEMRTPYVVYSLLTGDISPWTLPNRTPLIKPLEGFPVLAVWHNFHFCTMYVHTMFPDVGYFERSWYELLSALEAHRIRHDTLFYPTRVEPLEAWPSEPHGACPNDEHGVAKPWLAWFGQTQAPVMEKAFTAGYGISLYYDQMRFYWSYGSNLMACAHPVGADPMRGTSQGRYQFFFCAHPLPSPLSATTPLQLTRVRFYAARHAGTRTPLLIKLDDKLLAAIPPTRIAEQASLVELLPDQTTLTAGNHFIEITVDNGYSGDSYTLYRYESNYWKCAYIGPENTREELPHPYLEITLNGQREGRENAFAVLARCAVVHDYYVWEELVKDEHFADRLVAWVGEYHSIVRLAHIVHHVGENPVTVTYEDARKFPGSLPNRVEDITEQDNPKRIPFSISGTSVSWTAIPGHTYRLACSSN